jgi:hypothetical protein
VKVETGVVCVKHLKTTELFTRPSLLQQTEKMIGI